jgi:vancomycin resistance protein YoaR
MPLSIVEPLSQAFFALVGGFLLFLTLLVAVVIGYDIYHAGQIYPGVTVAGVDLSGLSQNEAADLLSFRLQYPEQGRITFQGDQVWPAKPAELGLYLDPQTSAAAAYSVGRQGDPFTRLGDQFWAWYKGVDLPPLLIYDGRIAYRYLGSIAAQVDQPTIEASLSVNESNVAVTPGQVGRSVDIEATLAPLETHLRSLTDGVFPVIMRETPPVILDASEQAEIAQQILSDPLILEIPDTQEGDPGPWTFDRQTLAGMMIIEVVETPQGARYQVGLDAESLRGFLQDIGIDFERQAANARFIFNDDTRQLEVIQPAVIGRTLDIDATIDAINQQVSQGDHTVSLVFDYIDPAVGDDATAEQLGITELVSVDASYFYGSSAARIQNIETASSQFHGVLVPPDGTFSMGEILGDVSLDNGYAEALIIFGNRTIKGVGGGVCQVSTTLFRTVFFGGYPVEERYSHAYRVSYYEQTASGNVNSKLAGLDATVFVPVVDFKFTNDTPNWLLMETYVNASARKLTWKFYSSSDGRTVDWDTTGLKNVVEPPKPLYQENPDLKKGEIKQVDWEAEGADVAVYRTVHRDGQVYFEDEFTTHYMPWRAVYEYGPGTKIPKDKKNND